MALWNTDNVVITRRGQDILSKVQAGIGNIIVSRVVTGGGYVAPSQLYAQTQVTSIKQQAIIGSVDTNENGSSIEVQVTNANLTTAYSLYQLGVYVTHPDYQGEVLYMLAQCDTANPDQIPLPSETALSLNYSLYMSHQGTSNVNITVDVAGMVTIKSFNDFKAANDTKINTHITDTVKHVTAAEKTTYLDKYTKKETDDALALKASANSVTSLSTTVNNHTSNGDLHVTKALKDTYADKYTKKEVDDALALKTNVTTTNSLTNTVNTHKDNADLHVTKALKDTYADKYTKKEVDDKLALKTNNAEFTPVSTEVTGAKVDYYGETKASVKASIDSSLAKQDVVYELADSGTNTFAVVNDSKEGGIIKAELQGNYYQDLASSTLKCVENPTVKISGKNMYDVSKALGECFVDNGDGTYTIGKNIRGCTAKVSPVFEVQSSVTTQQFVFRMTVVEKSSDSAKIAVRTQIGDTFTELYVSTVGEYVNYRVSGSSGKPLKGICFDVSGSANGDYLIVKDLQLEVGTVSTPYEPYIGYQNNYIVDLRKVGNVSDTLDLVSGKVTKRIGEVVLNGSESWMTADIISGSTTIYVFVNNQFDNAKNSETLNDSFLTTGYSDIPWIDEELIAFSLTQVPNTCRIRINKSRLATQDVAGFKAWLQANNVKVYYELATPEEYYIDVNPTYSYEGVTTLSQLSGNEVYGKFLAEIPKGQSNTAEYLSHVTERIVKNAEEIKENKEKQDLYDTAFSVNGSDIVFKKFGRFEKPILLDGNMGYGVSDDGNSTWRIFRAKYASGTHASQSGGGTFKLSVVRSYGSRNNEAYVFEVSMAYNRVCVTPVSSCCASKLFEILMFSINPTTSDFEVWIRHSSGGGSNNWAYSFSDINLHYAQSYEIFPQWEKVGNAGDYTYFNLYYPSGFDNGIMDNKMTGGGITDRAIRFFDGTLIMTCRFKVRGGQFAGSWSMPYACTDAEYKVTLGVIQPNQYLRFVGVYSKTTSVLGLYCATLTGEASGSDTEIDVIVIGKWR